MPTVSSPHASIDYCARIEAVVAKRHNQQPVAYATKDPRVIFARLSEHFRGERIDCPVYVCSHCWCLQSNSVGSQCLTDGCLAIIDGDDKLTLGWMADLLEDRRFLSINDGNLIDAGFSQALPCDPDSDLFGDPDLDPLFDLVLS